MTPRRSQRLMTESERNEFRAVFRAVQEFTRSRLDDHEVASFLLDLDRRVNELAAKVSLLDSIP